MLRLTRFACALAAMVVGAQAVGAAETAQKGPSANFEALDKDSDGKISLNEATEHDALFVAFEKLDKNKDAMLTREEFAGFGGR